MTGRTEPEPLVTQDSIVERVYAEVRQLAISFELRPGDRLNEVLLAKRLGVSRTPLREALNRLTSDGFLTALPKQGFFRRQLDPKEVFDLYELRRFVEAGSARHAADRASEEQIADADRFLRESAEDVPERTVDDLVDLDESFHLRTAEMSGNAEIANVLRNINARIRLVRWIDMRGPRRTVTQGEHRAILDAIGRRSAAEAAALMDAHVHRRLDQIIESVRAGYAQIYMPN